MRPFIDSSLQLIGHQLIIEAVEWDDQGMYQCFLTNDVGEDTRSTWLKIKSKAWRHSLPIQIFSPFPGEAPTVSTSKDMVVFNGTDVQLTCTVSGSPIPNITWTRIDSDRNMRERYYVDTRTGILSISNTIRNDSGVYECQAENILGTATARTSLLVRRKYPESDARARLDSEKSILSRSNKDHFLAHKLENRQSAILETCVPSL